MLNILMLVSFYLMVLYLVFKVHSYYTFKKYVANQKMIKLSLDNHEDRMQFSASDKEKYPALIAECYLSDSISRLYLQGNELKISKKSFEKVSRSEDFKEQLALLFEQVLNERDYDNAVLRYLQRDVEISIIVTKKYFFKNYLKFKMSSLVNSVKIAFKVIHLIIQNFRRDKILSKSFADDVDVEAIDEIRVSSLNIVPKM